MMGFAPVESFDLPGKNWIDGSIPGNRRQGRMVPNV